MVENMNFIVENIDFVAFVTIALACVEIALIVLIFFVAYLGYSERGRVEKLLKAGIVKEELEKLMKSKTGVKMIRETISKQKKEEEAEKENE